MPATTGAADVCVPAPNLGNNPGNLSEKDSTSDSANGSVSAIEADSGTPLPEEDSQGRSGNDPKVDSESSGSPLRIRGGAEEEVATCDEVASPVRPVSSSKDVSSSSAPIPHYQCLATSGWRSLHRLTADFSSESTGYYEHSVLSLRRCRTSLQHRSICT